MPEFNDENKPAYCHKGLYLFAYILLIIGWICVIIFLLIMCFCLDAACCVGVGIGLAGASDGGHHSRESPPVQVRIISADTV